jgi:CRP-like cAMP-binding protein
MNTHKQHFAKFIIETIDISHDMAFQIAEKFEVVEVQKNKITLKEGSIDSDFAFLCSGYLRSFVFDREGNEITTNIFKPNQMVFEVGSYFKQLPSHENVQTLTDCILVKNSFEKCQALFHSSAEFREFGRRMLVNQFIAYKERTLSLVTDNAEVRYDKFMLEHSDILQNVPLKFIASYLGVTNSSLSRLRHAQVKRQVFVK